MLGALKPAKGPFGTGDVKRGQDQSTKPVNQTMESVTQPGFQIPLCSLIRKH